MRQIPLSSLAAAAFGLAWLAYSTSRELTVLCDAVEAANHLPAWLRHQTRLQM